MLICIVSIKSIDSVYSTIDTEYIFHCEDDWEFYDSSFIEKSLKNWRKMSSKENLLKIMYKKIKYFSKASLID